MTGPQLDRAEVPRYPPISVSRNPGVHDGDGIYRVRPDHLPRGIQEVVGNNGGGSGLEVDFDNLLHGIEVSANVFLNEPDGVSFTIYTIRADAHARGGKMTRIATGRWQNTMMEKRVEEDECPSTTWSSTPHPADRFAMRRWSSYLKETFISFKRISVPISTLCRRWSRSTRNRCRLPL